MKNTLWKSKLISAIIQLKRFSVLSKYVISTIPSHMVKLLLLVETCVDIWVIAHDQQTFSIMFEDAWLQYNALFVKGQIINEEIHIFDKPTCEDLKHVPELNHCTAFPRMQAFFLNIGALNDGYSPCICSRANASRVLSGRRLLPTGPGTAIIANIRTSPDLQNISRNLRKHLPLCTFLSPIKQVLKQLRAHQYDCWARELPTKLV